MKKLYSTTRSISGRVYPPLAAAVLCLALGLVLSCSTTGGKPDAKKGYAFDEVWGYLMAGEEGLYRPSMPFTDVVHFCAFPSQNGSLRGVPKRSSVSVPRRVRVHLCIAELYYPAVTRRCLAPKSAEKARLIDDIVKASKHYDGIHIDFETVPDKDAAAYHEFLSDLGRRLENGKILSVAVPARYRWFGGPHDYAAMSRLTDRIVIMAYGEHWISSGPGPIASLQWSGRVASYARRVIPREKLIMGMPLYGLAWPEKTIRRTYRYPDVQRLLRETRARSTVHDGQVPYVEYTEHIKVKLFYEDNESLKKKLRVYRAAGADGVAFWRIGQGPADFWANVKSSGASHVSVSDE